MKCKYYDSEKLTCEIINDIPSHPKYCREKPENCNAYKYAEEYGLEKAKEKYWILRRT